MCKENKRFFSGAEANTFPRGTLFESKIGNQYVRVEGGVLSLQNLNYFRTSDPVHLMGKYAVVGSFTVRLPAADSGTLEELIIEDSKNASLTSASL